MNYSNTSSLICDYITLFFEDGNVTNGVAEWEIPTASYYYQTRGQMAVMSIADAVFNPNAGDDSILIATDSGFNGSVAQEGSADLIKNNLSVLGSFQQVGNTTMTEGIFAYFKTEPVKILTPARPNKIRLYFFKATNKNEFDIATGCVTIKFEYLSPEAEKEINDAVSYIPAFPEPSNI
jgi:hypothetical protein